MAACTLGGGAACVCALPFRWLCTPSHSPRPPHPRLPPPPWCRALLEGECADADDFPPGAIYVSEDFSTVGQITSYAADSAAAAAAAQQEALCRVESSSDLRKVPSVGQIEAN